MTRVGERTSEELAALGFVLPASNTWPDFAWPSWVPTESRKSIEEFWGEPYGRTPRAWAESALSSYNNPGRETPVAFGAEISAWHTYKPHVVVRGRYLPFWNNVYSLVTEDGKAVSAWQLVDAETLAKRKRALAEKRERLRAELEEIEQSAVEIERALRGGEQ